MDGCYRYFYNKMTMGIFAHRGGFRDRAGLDENTWEAIEYTASLPPVVLETDAHLTKDGEVVLLHDPYVERVWNGTGLISQVTWESFSKMRSRHGCRPARLKDVLEAFPHLKLNIDAKEDRVVHPLAKTILDAKAADRVRISSFSHRRLHTLRRVYGLQTAVSPWEIALLKISKRLYSIVVSNVYPTNGGNAAQVPETHLGLTVLTPRFIRAAKRNGLEVHVWTVNDVRAMKRLSGMGVDGIMTDKPANARCALQ